LVDGVLRDVTLELDGHISARVELWDFGTPLSIAPV
jgi:hypothetical protein